MNRQIKFRAWDKSKQMFIPTDLWAVVSTDFGAFGVMLKDWENYKEGEYFYSNSQIISQFTGLLDKNGKDIYEGDVITSSFTGDAKHEICYGEYIDDYDNPKAMKVGFYTIEDENEAQGFGKDINGTTDSYEVIGNIYEQQNKES